MQRADLPELLKAISVRDSHTIHGPNGTRARVKRHNQHTYSLDMQPPINRNRWGLRREITADIEHFMASGSLPGPDGDRW